jgi:hypothetical protein
LSASGGWIFSARAGRDFKRLDPPVRRRIEDGDHRRDEGQGVKAGQ